MLAVWLFLAIAVPAFAQDTAVPLSAFEADAECPSGGETDCALHALQRRAEGGNTKEGAVASPGTEEPIHDEGEVVYDPNVVLPDPSLTEVEAEGEDQNLEGGERDKDLSASQLERESIPSFNRRRGVPASTQSTGMAMCCKCQNGVVSWSASGTCSHCSSSGISETKKPLRQCTSSKAPNFPTPALCAQGCGIVFDGVTGGSGGLGRHCFTSTDGTCKITGCSSSRGGKEAVACVNGKCVCKAGYCSSDGHKCVRR